MNTIKIKTKTLQENVYDKICERIFSGLYPSGKPLREESLAEEFGVSRTPMREVFRMLAADGLVKLEPNRGAEVVGFTADDIEELYDIRRALEILAIECAAPLIPLTRLQDLRGRIESLAGTPDAEEHAALDQEFHRILHLHAHRRRLSSLLEQQYRLMQHFRHLGFRNPEQIKTAVAEHLAILDALLVRDTAAAIAAMNTHLQHSKRTILGLVT